MLSFPLHPSGQVWVSRKREKRRKEFFLRVVGEGGEKSGILLFCLPAVVVGRSSGETVKPVRAISKLLQCKALLFRERAILERGNFFLLCFREELLRSTASLLLTHAGWNANRHQGDGKWSRTRLGYHLFQEDGACEIRPYGWKLWMAKFWNIKLKKSTYFVKCGANLAINQFEKALLSIQSFINRFDE